MGIGRELRFACLPSALRGKLILRFAKAPQGTPKLNSLRLGKGMRSGNVRGRGKVCAIEAD